MTRMLAVAKKEFLHIRRDARTLFVAIAMPIAMLMLYGYAIDMDLKQVRIAVLDEDRSPESRDLLARMTSGNTFRITSILTNREEFSDGFAANRYRAIVAIAPGFGEDIATHRDAQFQVIVDGSDANSANVISNHIKAISQQISLENVAKRFGKKPEPPIELKTRIWYNEEMRSPVFIVPGLVALFLIMLCALLTSVAVAREKEFGTLEQVLTTPVHPAEVIIGKVLPYMGIAIVDTVLVIGIGIVLFNVPLRGSVLALCGYSVVYLLVALGMGLLISVSVKTQQLALMVALMVTMIPTLLLSGLIFPIASMPLPLQILSNIVPARWYIEIVRGIMLKGENYYPIQATVLTVMAVVALSLSIKKFHGQMGGV